MKNIPVELSLGLVIFVGSVYLLISTFSAMNEAYLELDNACTNFGGGLISPGRGGSLVCLRDGKMYHSGEFKGNQ